MTRRAPSDDHIDAARSRLGDLSGLAARTHAAELRILEEAERRREAVQSDLDKLKPRAIGDTSAGDEYQRLLVERGQLDIIIAKAREATK